MANLRGANHCCRPEVFNRGVATPRGSAEVLQGGREIFGWLDNFLYIFFFKPFFPTNCNVFKCTLTWIQTIVANGKMEAVDVIFQSAMQAFSYTQQLSEARRQFTHSTRLPRTCPTRCTQRGGPAPIDSFERTVEQMTHIGNSMPPVSLKVKPNFRKWSEYFRVFSLLRLPLLAATSAAGSASLACSLVVPEVDGISLVLVDFFGRVTKRSILYGLLNNVAACVPVSGSSVNWGLNRLSANHGEPDRASVCHWCESTCAILKLKSVDYLNSSVLYARCLFINDSDTATLHLALIWSSNLYCELF